MFWVDVAKNRVIVSQIIYQIVPYARDFLPIKFFFKCGFKKLVSSYLKLYREQMKGFASLAPVRA